MNLLNKIWKGLKKLSTNKDFRMISSFIVILVMGFLIYKSYINNPNPTVNAKTDETYTVKVINVNPDGGLATIAYKEGDNYIDTNETEYVVKAGTKIKFYFKDGIKEGYNVYLWANYDETLNIVKDTDDNTLYYTKESLVKTINEDLSVVIALKSDNDNVVFFYDSSVMKQIIGIDVVKNNTEALFEDFGSVKKQGFDFTNWSEDITHVTKDLNVYPQYDSSVWSVFRDYYPMFLKGLGVTLLLSVISVFCALFLGIVLCIMRMSSIKIVKFISATYVEVIRGIPLLLQLLVIYVILGPTKIHIGSFFTTEVLSCLIALFINSGAYSSEIFRSGIQAVDKGQMEAGRALGMSKWKVLIKIVIPQGIKNSLPSIGNELVAMVKETSLAVSIDASIGELMSVRKQITSATYINLPPYIVVAIIYFCVTFTLSKLIGLLEKRLEKHEF